MTATKPITLYVAEQPVKSVTIFQSSIAQITRTFSVALKRGKNELEISGISSLVDTDSPHIHGLGPDAHVLVFCTTHRARAPGVHRGKHATRLKEIAAKRKALEAERTVLTEKAALLIDMARAAVNASSMGGDGPAQLGTVLEDLMRQKREAATGILALEREIGALEEERWTLNNTHLGETTAVVSAKMVAKRDCEVEFQMTYLVTGASWTPYYDLRATTLEGKTSPAVTVMYCANITQSTGEDWTDTILTLSTANSALKTLTVPSLKMLKISPIATPQRTPRPSVLVSRHTASLGLRSQASGAAIHENENEDEDEDEDFVEVDPEDAGAAQLTTLDRSPLSLAYRVESAVSLPSDGIARKIAVATLEFASELRYVCAPRMSHTVFIEARVKNTSEYELLAGPVSVFMDDGFVTKTSIGRIAVNQTFDCVLGIDTALRVSYNARSRIKRESLRNLAAKTTTRTVTTSVTNYHGFDITGLVVQDTIPIGDGDANLRVMLRKPEGLALAKDGEEVCVRLEGEGVDAKVRWTNAEDGKGGEKDGMYEWVCGIAAGKKVELEAEWEVKALAKQRWEVSVKS